MNVMVTAYLPDDLGVRLLGIQISAKKAEEAARRALGDSLTGPGALVPVFLHSWLAAKDAESRVHREIRRPCRRVVVPMIRRVVA